MSFSFLDEDEARLTHPNSPQLVSCIPIKQSSVPEVSGVMKDVISQLLNVLASKYNYKENEGEVTNCHINFVTSVIM